MVDAVTGRDLLVGRGYGHSMRRVPVATLAVLLLAGTGAASYEVGARRERQSRNNSACHEAVGLQKQLEDRASTLVAAIPPLETSNTASKITARIVHGLRIRLVQ
jgi:hypothetical protein